MEKQGVMVFKYDDETPIFIELNNVELARLMNFIDDLPNGHCIPLFIRIGDEIFSTDDIQRMRIVG